jgi:hypothetical protein
MSKSGACGTSPGLDDPSTFDHLPRPRRAELPPGSTWPTSVLVKANGPDPVALMTRPGAIAAMAS